jgi:hypothetical protein
MIIPSETKWQTGTTLADTLDGALERALVEIPLRVIPVVPQRDTFGECSPQARQLAELIGDLFIGDEIDTTTGHAWLVVLGYFAQALGLVTGLEGTCNIGQILDTNLNVLYNVYILYKGVCVWSACSAPLRRARTSRSW